MNRYHSPCPRVAIGAAAVAITATIFGVAVIAPASLKGRTFEHAAAAAAIRPASDADTPPLRIEVFGVRAPKVISLQPDATRNPKADEG
jgi:hypothetical protein